MAGAQAAKRPHVVIMLPSSFMALTVDQWPDVLEKVNAYLTNFAAAAAGK